MARRARIELASADLESAVLPLNDLRVNPEAGLEPATQGHCGPSHYQLCYSGKMAPEVVFETTNNRLTAERSTAELLRNAEGAFHTPSETGPTHGRPERKGSRLSPDACCDHLAAVLPFGSG